MLVHKLKMNVELLFTASQSLTLLTRQGHVSQKTMTNEQAMQVSLPLKYDDFTSQ